MYPTGDVTASTVNRETVVVHTDTDFPLILFG